MTAMIWIHQTESESFESMQNGYMLSYYLMDLRDQGDDKAADHSSGDHASHGEKQMDKPHHIMVYIMDQDHEPVTEAKVGCQ